MGGISRDLQFSPTESSFTFFNLSEVPNFWINLEIRILSGYLNKLIQCGLNFLFFFFLMSCFFFHDQLAPSKLMVAKIMKVYIILYCPFLTSVAKC